MAGDGMTRWRTSAVLALMGLLAAGCGGSGGETASTTADSSSAPASQPAVLTGEAAGDICKNVTQRNGTQALAAGSSREGTVCVTGHGQSPDISIDTYVDGDMTSSLLYDQCSYADYQSGSSGSNTIPGTDMTLAQLPSGAESAVLANGDRAAVVQYGGISLVLVVAGTTISETGTAVTRDRPRTDADDTADPGRPAAC